ncbi:MAG: prepilin-type N-terminal cleavage/methylation domain-containing protein [Proteobacteria bacterium]|nr:prepilin-type N-terminal cleavage/methylation domain-containing protein [Pseudomonadota bacterium]
MKDVSGQRGFSLMELLIALSLFAAIAGILMNSFFQFSRQSQRLETILKLRQELRILEQIIRNDVQAVVYLDKFMEDPQKQQDGRKSGIYGVDESGGDYSKDNLHMHVNNISRFHRNLTTEQDPELHEVSYYLEEEEGGAFKFKRREEFFVDADITAGERSITHTLSNKIVSFDVKYFKSTAEEASDEWDSSSFVTTGLAADKIPAGVIVELKIESDNGESLTSDMTVNIQPYMGQYVEWGQQN